MKIVSSIVLAALMTFAAPFALAQSTDEILNQLLRPGGWIYEWKPGPTNKLSPDHFGLTGHGEMLFQAQGDAVVVTIQNMTVSTTCKRDVTISGGIVMFNPCIASEVKLHFDPADHDFPFKGESAIYDWRLKPK